MKTVLAECNNHFIFGFLIKKLFDLMNKKNFLEQPQKKIIYLGKKIIFIIFFVVCTYRTAK